MTVRKKTTLFDISIFILFVTLSVAAIQPFQIPDANFFPYPGPDLQRIYIRNDGTVEPATAPIEKTNSLYKLTSNIVLQTIEIQRNNIVLDGSNYLIEGNGSWVGTAARWDDAGNNGVVMAGRNNITITHLTIEKCTTGIRISDSSQISVNGVAFTSETGSMYTPKGIAIQDSSFIQIENNSFINVGSAIVCNGTNNLILGNTVNGGGGNIDGSVSISGSSNMISDNKIEGVLPITINKAESSIIAQNNITGPEYKGNEGIALFGSSNGKIFGNNITGFVNQAIRTVFGCSNNTVYGNYFSNNGFAVTIQDGAVNNTFYGNTFTADSCKIHIDDSVESTHWDNGTIGNYWGDYKGADGNNDGIGDFPYIVNGYKWDTKVDGFVSFVSGQDNYPLMKPYDIEHDSVVWPRTEPLIFVLAAVAVSVVVIAGLLIYCKKRKHKVKP